MHHTAEMTDTNKQLNPESNMIYCSYSFKSGYEFELPNDVWLTQEGGKQCNRDNSSERLANQLHTSSLVML